MVSRQVYKTGLQIIADTVRPIALRACNGSKFDREFRPAFLVSHNSDPDELSIVAEKGLYINDRKLEIRIGDDEEMIVANSMIDSSISYEVFNYTTR